MKKMIAAGAAACLFLALGFASCGDGGWEIAESGSLKARLKETDGGYVLSVTGRGSMKNWASASETPWHGVAGEIVGVELGLFVETVGDHAFEETAIDRLVLAENTAYVAENALPAGAKLFAYGAAEYGGKAEIYRYAETVPPTDDRYWQSDQATGNIADGEFEEADKVWHYVGSEATVWDRTDVLFIGNSFTYTNNIPQIFDEIAADLGYYTATYAVTGPGWRLMDHAKEDDVCGKQVDAILSAKHDFDYIVLQEHSVAPIDDPEGFTAGVRALCDKIRLTQDRAQIYLYATWGYPSLAQQEKYGGSVEEMERKLTEAYEKNAALVGAGVCPVGKAFTAAQEIADLYGTDRKHPSYAGSYLAACVHAATLLGADVTAAKFCGELGEAQAAALRAVAM